jgi:hypothetical protein
MEILAESAGEFSTACILYPASVERAWRKRRTLPGDEFPLHGKRGLGF